jgi:hypothetical protein
MNSPYFDLEELVCKDVFDKYGAFAWNFFDPRLIELINILREKLNKPIFVNDWKEGGKFDERGLRCPKCDIVKTEIAKGNLYMSAHTLGKAVDFTVQGLLAEETRLWIAANKRILPYGVRLESGVTWVHLDLFNNSDQKVIFFSV